MPPIISGFILVSATTMLVVSLATDTIPEAWPFGPWHREDHPVAFRRFVGGLTVVAVTSAILLIFTLLR